MASETVSYRPTRFRVRLIDPLSRLMVRLGLGPGRKSNVGVRILELRGRKTGRWYQRPVYVNSVNGERAIVSAWGESQWARNLRGPAPEARLRFANRVEPIVAHEIRDGEEKPTFMLALCRQNPSFARFNFKVDAKTLTREQAREAFARYPVFQIETRR